MSDNSIAVLQAADAYHKQLQVRNKWLDTEGELVRKLEECRNKVRETNDELRALRENLCAQAGGYAPSTPDVQDLRSAISDAVRESHVIRQGC